MLAATLAAVNSGNGIDLLCKILLVGLVVSLIVGLAAVLGFGGIGDRVGGRFNALFVFVVLLVVYVVFC